MRSQRNLWIALIITILLGSLWQFYPLPSAEKRLNHIPYLGQGYISKDLPLSDSEKEMFKNVDVVKRLYEIDGHPFFVTVLDGTHNRHVVHDPSYCFRGSGWIFQKSTVFPLANGDANLVDIKKGDEEKTALYWFSDGKESFTSSLRYWWEATLRRITLGYS